MREITDESYPWERKPKEQKYISVNFETVGKCPKCNNTVTCSISHTDITCKHCGLKLCWD